MCLKTKTLFLLDTEMTAATTATRAGLPTTTAPKKRE